MMQKHSSKNTSVNTTKLPIVYSKVNWSRYASLASNYHVIDVGCGRIETQRLIRDKLKHHKIRNFYPMDPYHECIVDYSVVEQCINNHINNKVIVCSNVLNVIDDDNALLLLIRNLCDMIVFQLEDGTYRMNPCYITVYEGNKSGVGHETKEDCWQRNERLISYLSKFNDYIKQKYSHNANFFRIKYGMIIGAIQYGGHISYE
jgi:hypothetical protein